MIVYQVSGMANNKLIETYGTYSDKETALKAQREIQLFKTRRWGYWNVNHIVVIEQQVN